jgi:hypothetical protein
MIARWLARVALAAVVGTMAFAGIAQASNVPSQAEVDRAISALKNGSARIVERKRESPAWFTSALKQEVLENGTAQAPADAPLPGQVGIRPGSMMISPFICTMNFIFRQGDTLAIGTAGHCLEAGEPVVLLTVAPGGENPVLVELGRVLLKRDGGIGQDYGLVEIPANLRDWVFPTISAIGGPCGVFAGGDPQPVAHYGHGLVGGAPGTPRVGMGFELTDEQQQELRRIVRIQGVDWDWDADSIVWAGYNYGGDSGSPVRIAQLPAVSNLTHGIGVTGLEPSPISWGTRVTTVGWSIVNSPLCLPGGGTSAGADSGNSSGKGKGKPKRG